MPIPTDVSPKLFIKFIPTQFQNNIRDFHYEENKQYLTQLQVNDDIEEEEGILDIEVFFPN